MLLLTFDVNNISGYTFYVVVTFKSKKLQEICNTEKKLVKEYGKVCAKKIRTRLDDLKAATTLEAFRTLPGRCHELKGDRKGQLSFDLEHPLRLVFDPAGDDVQNKKDGGLDWNSVKAVKIIGVEDTHD